MAGDLEARARLHAMLRFAGGTAAAFVVSEFMGWYPTFLPPLFTGMLLANVPRALPVKAGLFLVLVECLGAYGAFTLATLLHGTPIVLFGLLSLVIFVCFANLARGRGFLPILLVLICFATIPIVTMVLPQQADALSLTFTRSMAVAVVATWVAHVVWPATAKAVPPGPKTPFASPIAMAIGGSAIVLPLMLVYLMFGIPDALPVLITTIVLVINFDPRRGAVQAVAMMLGNLIGGMTAVLALSVLQTAPTLANLCLVTFLIGCVFASRIASGGAGGLSRS
jgi:hypothetical protein